MNDDAAIRNLIGAYAQATDDGRAADVAALFADDGELESMGVLVSGRAAIESTLSGLLGNPMKHAQSNTVIAVTNDSASASTDLVVLAPDDAGTWGFVGCARYADSLVRAEGGWKLRRRVCTWHDRTPGPVIDAMRALMTGTAVGT